MIGRLKSTLAAFQPRSIRAGTIAVLAATLIVSQLIGLAFYGYDRALLERQVEGRDLRQRIEMAQKVIAAAPMAGRERILEALKSSDLFIQIAPLGPAGPPSALKPPEAPQTQTESFFAQPDFPRPGFAQPGFPQPGQSPFGANPFLQIPNIPISEMPRIELNFGPGAGNGPDLVQNQADMNRRIQDEFAHTMGQAIQMQDNMQRALDQARAFQDRIQDQILEANETLQEHILAAREQIEEAHSRVAAAQRDAAQTQDPEARSIALDEAKSANEDALEAERELGRLTQQVSNRMVRLQLPLPTGDQMIQVTAKPIHAPFNYTRFIAVFALCATVILSLGWWATRRVTAPLALFGAAAERLGRNADSAPLPEDGPDEVRQAAAAFNRMQARVKKFIADRTTMLAAISHDLRTPLTRMRLRVEFVADDEDRAKLIADLDEMEAMISESLAFARNEAEVEPVMVIDLEDLCRNVVDDQTAVGAKAEYISNGPAQVLARPSSLKRALTNLVRNAVLYGGSAQLHIEPEADGFAIIVADNGPGIPEADLERVFTPFLRLEESRNKASGGVGLGLSVARSTARAHGGDISLTNRAQGGLAARLFLPAAPTEAGAQSEA